MNVHLANMAREDDVNRGVRSAKLLELAVSAIMLLQRCDKLGI